MMKIKKKKKKLNIKCVVTLVSVKTSSILVKKRCLMPVWYVPGELKCSTNVIVSVCLLVLSISLVAD